MGPSGRKRAPNMPSEATSAEPPASWPDTGKRNPGAIWAKTCFKQAFRGHFCRAAGQLARNWKKVPWGHLGENVLQTCLQRPLLPSRRAAGRNLEKGPWGHLGEKVLQTSLQRPLLRAAGELAGTWTKGPWAIQRKTCSKQAFRGHFCRAAGQLAGTSKKVPWGHLCENMLQTSLQKSLLASQRPKPGKRGSGAI